MTLVTLKNGTSEAKELVVSTMMILDHIMEERPIAFYDLVMRCRDGDYQFFADNGDYLKRLKLVDQDDSIHGSIHNIVLSASDGEGMDIVLRSPVDEEAR